MNSTIVFVRKFILPFLAAMAFTLNSHASDGTFEIYYIRSDVKITNGLESENRLLMIPANDDYRATEFTFVKISGKSQLGAEPDALSAAKHNAFKHLLRQKGTKSIQGKSLSDKKRVHDEIIMSFEGYIKTPYNILKQTVDKKDHTLNIEMEILFAPLAYPSDWSFKYYKKKLYDILKNMISVFH